MKILGGSSYSAEVIYENIEVHGNQMTLNNLSMYKEYYHELSPSGIRVIMVKNFVLMLSYKVELTLF